MVNFLLEEVKYQLINVKILAKNYGDKSGQMTIQQFKQVYKNDLSKHGQWAIFADDTAVAPDEIDSIKDGQNVSVVPQIAGG